MDRLPAYCYGLSAASFAVHVTWAREPSMWTENPITSMVLGFTIPANIASAWLLEHRPISVHHWFYQAYCWATIAIGTIALSLFTVNISSLTGIGFLGGILAALSAVQGLTDPYPQAFGKGQEDKDQQTKVE